MGAAARLVGTADQLRLTPRHGSRRRPIRRGAGQRPRPEVVADLEANPARGGHAALLVCAAEEAPRFGAGTVGSRLLTGTLAASELADLTDADGISAAEAQAGYLEALADLPRITPPLDRLLAHAEVHVATRRGLDGLGVVRHVASPRRFAITVTGESGHAGEVSMRERRDALTAAAEIVLATESAAREQPAQTVATIGTLTVSPGAVSVIPALPDSAWTCAASTRPPCSSWKAC